MKNLLNLIILFVIAAVILVLIQYFQKPQKIILPTTNNSVSTTTITDKNPALTANQEAVLEKIGIDPSKLPTKLTPELEACFISKIGAERLAEIKKGSLPTASEIVAGKTCLNLN